MASGPWLEHVAYMRMVIIGAALIALAGCATMDEPDLVAWLEAQGYSEVRKTGASNWLHGCAAPVQTATEFTARAPGGKLVDGVVCLSSVFTGGRYVANIRLHRE